MDWNIIGVYVAIFTFVIPFLILASNWILEYTGLKSNKRKREEANQSFENIVKDLSSDNPVAQLSSAILLRRFFTLKIGKKYYLHNETVDVISAILRTLPTGVYQKTLADGLSYAKDLTKVDLQRINLQNVYLGKKKDVAENDEDVSTKDKQYIIVSNGGFAKIKYRLIKFWNLLWNDNIKIFIIKCRNIFSTNKDNGNDDRLRMHQSDLFMANLTEGLIDNVDAVRITLYNSILYGTIIKNSDFSYADFRGADLTNAKFTNVKLWGADFSGAINIPSEIKSTLENGICKANVEITTNLVKNKKDIFFSMPGNMSKSDELTVKAFNEYMSGLGFKVIYYTRDTYPRFGQLTKIKASIEKCAGMIAFGTKQTFIKEGVYRPGMSGERFLNETWLSTPWNEVEVGMATMIGIPILLVKDDEIEDGIFDEVISESFVSTLTSKIDVRELDRNQVLAEWLSKIV